MMQFLAVAVFTSKREQPDIYESKRTTEETNLIVKKVNYWNHLIRFYELQKNLRVLVKNDFIFFLEKCIVVLMNFALIQSCLGYFNFHSFSKFPDSFN